MLDATKQPAPRLVMTSAEVRATVARVARDIIHRNDSRTDLVLVGIQRKGVPLADRLQCLIRQLYGIELPVAALDVSRHRDDRLWHEPVVSATTLPVELTRRRVVLVDDVFYTGRTIRAALAALTELGRPEAVHVAVLVARGHRELPIRPDYVGRNIPTTRAEQVHVLLRELGGDDTVRVVQACSSGSCDGRDRAQKRRQKWT